MRVTSASGRTPCPPGSAEPHLAFRRRSAVTTTRSPGHPAGALLHLQPSEGLIKLPITVDRTCGKKRFRDHREAVKALHQAHKARVFAEIDGIPTVRREVRCYQCDVCAGVHLTSQVG